MVKTAVLFETFARPEFARQVFDAIKACKPNKFYFYSNKAREDRIDEIERNEEIRSWVKEIDWDCELHTWFRDEYVDIYTSLMGSKDWVAKNEEEWIVLEEDVVPTPAFFSFCDQMLDRFRDDQRVWFITGGNVLSINPSNCDYSFTHYHGFFGHATWRNRWMKMTHNYDVFAPLLKDGYYDSFFKTKEQSMDRSNLRRKTYDFVKETGCWDYLFGMCCDLQHGFGVVPNRHLITNVGVSGEHHNAKTLWNNPAEIDRNQGDYKIEYCPAEVKEDFEYDYILYKKVYKQPCLFKRGIRRLLRLIQK